VCTTILVALKVGYPAVAGLKPQYQGITAYTTAAFWRRFSEHNMLTLAFYSGQHRVFAFIMLLL